jgi:hypothetical protein
MSCPCGLTKEEVKDFDQRKGLERVPLIGGKCQNPLADGSEGICGRPLGAHQSSQSMKINILFLIWFIIYLYLPSLFPFVDWIQHPCF